MPLSVAVSALNALEVLRISAPTVIDAARRRVDRKVCDERLQGFADRIVSRAEVDLHVAGREHVPQGSPVVVMSNHQSLYDVPVLFHVLGSRMRMVAKKELFAVPIFGDAMRAAGFICVDRQNRRSAIESLSTAKDLFREGTWLWIAPEGTRSQDGALLPFKKGGFMVALDAKVPILPVTLDGTRNILETKRVRSRTGQRVDVTIHPPLGPEPYVHEEGGRERLVEDVRRAIVSGFAGR